MVVNFIMKNEANYENVWFREKRFEKKLYKLLRVHVWKKHIPTFNPDTFDINKRSLKEIVGATCQSEIVHEIIMLLCFLPVVLIPFLGGEAIILITSFLSMLIDSIFVIIQRYNRPKLIKVMSRFNKLS